MIAIALPARAKLNLDLQVLRRAPDGYHDIVTTMQAIDLHDLLEMAPATETSYTSSGFAVPEQNSVVKAHQAFEQAAGKPLPATIHLHKRIPPGSGFGGASSDAAATLRTLKSMYHLDIDLAPIAKTLGADVPFFLHGGCMRAEGRGERLTRLPAQRAWFALAWPRIELSTAEVYRAWDDVKGDKPNELRRAAEHVNQRVHDFGNKLGKSWQMTGSGSAFFLRCESEALAKRAIAGLDCWTAVTQAVDSWG